MLAVFNNQQTQSFTLDVEGVPTGLQFDPNNNILKDLTVTSVENTGILPAEFSLCQNYPNPFNPSTVIEFTVAKASHVTLSVFDISGRELVRLVDKQLAPGQYTKEFNTTALSNTLSSGVYFYRLKTPEFVETKKMMLLK